eukprot:5031354-Lingulodinium_polyedra.AAC.1
MPGAIVMLDKLNKVLGKFEDEQRKKTPARPFRLAGLAGNIWWRRRDEAGHATTSPRSGVGYNVVD